MRTSQPLKNMSVRAPLIEDGLRGAGAPSAPSSENPDASDGSELEDPVLGS